MTKYIWIFINSEILNIKGTNYRYVINLISKNESINLLQNWVEHYKAENYKTEKIYYRT